jgi:hypothetical protein
MQRWILLGVATVFLAVCGSGFAYWTYKQGRPNPVWVPIPLNREVPDEKRAEIADKLRENLNRSEVLNKISADLHLAKKWNMSTDEIAAKEVAKRLFVKIGEADTAMGKVPSINVGVEGTRKDAAVSNEIVMRMMKDVWKILGVKPPPEKPF